MLTPCLTLCRARPSAKLGLFVVNGILPPPWRSPGSLRLLRFCVRRVAAMRHWCASIRPVKKWAALTLLVLLSILGLPPAAVAASGGPSIQSVVFSGAGVNPEITVTGAGFGSPPASMPTSGDTANFSVTDTTRGWQAGCAGWSGNGPCGTTPDAITLDYQSWTDSRIVIAGFGGAYGTDGYAAPGDSLTIAVLGAGGGASAHWSGALGLGASAGTMVTGVSVAASSTQEGASANYTVRFTTSQTGALSGGGTIVLGFLPPLSAALGPYGVSAGGVSVAVTGAPAQGTAGSGWLLTLGPEAAIGDGATVQVTLRGVANAAVPTTQIVTVATSADILPVGASLLIGGGATAGSGGTGSPAVLGVTLASTSNTAGATADYTVAFATDRALPAGGGITLIASGTGFPSQNTAYVITDQTHASGDGTAVSVSKGPGSVSFTVPNAISAGDQLTVAVAGVRNPEIASGSERIAVSTSTDTALAISPAYTLSPAAAAKLAYISQPGNAVAGTAFASQPAVAVEDRFGNVVDGNQSAVSLSIMTNPGGGSLRCAGNPSDVVGGVSGFQGCTIDKAGSGYTLKASDGGLASAVSGAFDVVASSQGASRLVFTVEPGGGPAGVAWNTQPRVTVEDSSGNAVTSYNGGVALNIVAGAGTPAGALNCSANPVTPVDGVATFGGCSINLAGVGYTLRANSGGLTLTTSTPFDVGASADGIGTMSVLPTSVAAGSTGNTLTFTYTAAAAGVTDGELDIVVPNGWTAPGTVPGVAGLTTASTGAVAVSGSTIRVTGVTLASGQTLTLTYGDGGGAAGVTAPSGGGPVTFTTMEKSSAGGTLTPLPISPGVTVNRTAVATHLSLTATASVTAGAPFSVTLGVDDAYGHVVTGYTGTVDFTASGQAGLPATYTFTPADQGTRVFTVTLKTAGFQTVSVRDTATQTLTGSASVTVIPAAVSQLLLTTFSAQQTAGSQFGLIVTAADRYGNTVTGYTGTVHFTTDDGSSPSGVPPVLPGDYTFNAGDGGTHTFGGIILYKAGTARVTVTDTAFASITGTSVSLTVNPGTATQLVFTTQPGGGAAGAAWSTQPALTVEDARGNPVTSSTVGVALGIEPNPGGGTLTCRANPVTATAGVATFSGCAVHSAGNGYTLRATSSGLSGATSGAFDVTGSTSPLTITTPTTLPDATVGQMYSQTLTAAGGTGSYTWSSAQLGATGLSLSRSGTLSGASVSGPAGGVFGFTIQVQDSHGATASATFSLPIVAPAVRDVTTPQVSPSTAFDADATYTVGFTTSATGGLISDGSINLEAPQGTIFSTQASDYAVQAGSPPVTVPVRGVVGNPLTPYDVTITLGAGIAASTPVRVTARNTGNPGAPSTTETLTVSSSADTRPATSADYAITAIPAPPAGLAGSSVAALPATVSYDTQSPPATLTVAIAVHLADGSGHPLSGREVSMRFSYPGSNPSGAVWAFNGPASALSGGAGEADFRLRCDLAGWGYCTPGPLVLAATDTTDGVVLAGPSIPVQTYSIRFSGQRYGGGTADISASGLPPNEAVTAASFNGAVVTLRGGCTTDASGALGGSGACGFTVPAGTAGTSYPVVLTVNGLPFQGSFTMKTSPANTPAAIAATAGTGQQTTVGTSFDTSLRVTVTNGNGNPVGAGVPVTFTMHRGANGADATFAASAIAPTDSKGVATAPALTANTVAGAFTVTATIGGVANPATFSLSNIAGAPASMAATAGDGQGALIGTAFANPLQATVTDAYGNPVNHAMVTFTAPSSGASGTFAGGVTTATAQTDGSGVAQAPTLTAGATAGSFSVTAAVGGVATAVRFSLTATELSIAASAGSGTYFGVGTDLSAPDHAALTVKVTDSGGKPVADAGVTFTVPGSGPSGGFSVDGHTQRAVTVPTQNNGTATAPQFTANGIPGRFSVTAATAGAPTPAVFALTNAAFVGPVNCQTSNLQDALDQGGLVLDLCPQITLEAPIRVATGLIATLLGEPPQDGSGTPGAPQGAPLLTYGTALTGSMIDVTGGSLTLQGLDVEGGIVSGATGSNGGSGAGVSGQTTPTPGVAGQDAPEPDTCSSLGCGPTAGSPGASVQGGAINIASKGTVVLDHVTIDGSRVYGGIGGDGGKGGSGGKGGGTIGGVSGGPAAMPGGNGADGAPGGPGGAAQGGAIYNAGSLTVEYSAFTGDTAMGGQGGVGGGAGKGGSGGGGQSGNKGEKGPLCGSGTAGGTGSAGAAGGDAGRPGNGGRGGNAQGGAIYNAGALVISHSDFAQNQATGGDGQGSGSIALAGDGGKGGNGGNGGAPGNSPKNGCPPGSRLDYGPGGAGGTNGSGGEQRPGAGLGGNGVAGEGGAIFNAGTLSVDGTSFELNVADGGNGGAGAYAIPGGWTGGWGGLGSVGGFGDPTGPPNPGGCTSPMAGADGGNSGSGLGGAIYTATPATLTAVAYGTGPNDGNRAVAGDAVGPGGYGYGGTSVCGGYAPAGNPGTPGAGFGANLFTVGADNAGLQITTTSLPGVPTGQGVLLSLQASGGTVPYTWSLAPGAPAWLGIYPSGYLYGTPTRPGVYTFTAKVADTTPGVKQTASQVLSLDVTGAWDAVTGDAAASAVGGVAAAGGEGTGTPDTAAAASGGSGTVAVTQYAENPETRASFESAGRYFDVVVSPGNSFQAVRIKECKLVASDTVYWFDGTRWVAATPQKFDPRDGCIVVGPLNSSTSSPTLSELTGTPFAVGTEGTALTEGDTLTFSHQPLATEGSLGAGQTVNGAVYARTAAAAAIPGATVYLATAAGNVGQVTAGVDHTPLTTTPQPFATDGSGAVPFSDRAPGTLPSVGVDTIVASSDATANPILTAADRYTYRNPDLAGASVTVSSNGAGGAGALVSISGSVLDANGQPVANADVTLTASAGTLSSTSVTTGADGTYGVTYAAPDTASAVTIWASVLGANAPLAATTIIAPPGVTVTAAASATSVNGTAATGGSGGMDETTATASGGSGVVAVAEYSANPGGSPTFTPTGTYFDIALSPGNSFTVVRIAQCGVPVGNGLYWWNGTTWTAASNQTTAAGCVGIAVTALTQPTLTRLSGTPFAVGAPPVPVVSTFPPPVVSGIEPASGTAAGGTSVAIRGTNLATATAVDFGTTAARAFTVVSDTEIQTTAPAGTGAVDVTVVTPAGRSATSAADQFIYQPPARDFSDVPRTHWAYPYIRTLASRGIIVGFPDGTFRPDESVTRAQFVKMLELILGVSLGNGTTPFSDVPASAWFAPYVSSAVQAGIVQGFSPHTFGPNEPLTREQAAVLLARALKLAGTTAPQFTDEGSDDAWAAPAVQASAAAGYMTGFPDGSFRPLDPMTRAQAAKVLALVLGRDVASGSRP